MTTYFSLNTSKEYKDWTFTANKKELFYGSVLGGGTYMLFLFVDALLLGSFFTHSLLIRSILLFPVIFVTLIARTNWNKNYTTNDFLGSLIILLPHLGHFLLINHYKGALPTPYFLAGTAILLVFQQLMLGITFWRGTMVGSFMILSFAIYQLFFASHSMSYAIFEIGAMTVGYLGLMAGRGSMEKSKISNYLLIQELEQSTKELELQKNLLAEGEKINKTFSWRLDPDKKMVKLSSGVFPFYNAKSDYLPPQEVFGNVFKLMHPDDQARLASLQQEHENKRDPNNPDQADEFNRIAPLVYRVLLDNGQTVWLKDNTSKFVENEGFYGSTQDITEVKEIEITLNNQAEELKRKKEEIEQILYATTHDLKEPIRTIDSFIALLKMELASHPNPEVQTFLSFIADSSIRMNQLIEGLLNFSRLGQKEPIQEVNCEEVIEEVIKDLAFSIKTANATIEREPLPSFIGYKTEIRLLFQNLISNAIKFRKADIAPIIQINVSENSTFYTFSIIDNGIGVDEKFQEMIFQLFRRVNTKTEYEGTGIGLANCKKIVELHNGKIWVTSEKNKGTTFYFTISKNLKQ